MHDINLVLGISNTFCGLLIGLLAIPLIKEKVKMNNWYGVRFAKSYESEENWRKINRKGGIYMLAWSIPIFLLGLSCFVQPKLKGALLWVNLSAPFLILGAVVQSYAYARKL